MFVVYILATFVMFVFGMFIGFYFGIHVDDEDKRRKDYMENDLDDSMISMTAAIIERLKKEKDDE